MIFSVITTVYGENSMLPPEDLRGEWAELHKLKFSGWDIKKFNGWDVPFDGGSKVFFFEFGDEERFDLMIANPAYWTEQDKRERRQVFILIRQNRFYRVEPRSDEEKILIKKLKEAAGQLSGEGRNDPKLLIILAERLKSRKPIFKSKG